MKHFKLEFEIRRILFGLLSILKTPADRVPGLVQQQLPQIMQQIGELANRVYGERLKCLEENEKCIAKGFGFSDDEDADSADEDGEGDEAAMEAETR